MKPLITFLGLSLVLITAFSSSKTLLTANRGTSEATLSQTSKDIVGVWAFVGNIGEAASRDKKIKIILDKRWMFSQPDPITNLTLFHHGGSYLLDGNTYAETIEYANETTGGFLGQTFKYEVKIEGDSMRLTGVGNVPFNEIWKRVK